MGGRERQNARARESTERTCEGCGKKKIKLERERENDIEGQRISRISGRETWGRFLD